MNTMEKLGAAIAGIAIVAGIIIYATSGTSAFSPQPIDRTYPNIAIYIADSGDDTNSGRIITEPVRTIRGAVDRVNDFDLANVSILFTEDEYTILDTDDGTYGEIATTNKGSLSIKPVSSIDHVNISTVEGLDSRHISIRDDSNIENKKLLLENLWFIENNYGDSLRIWQGSIDLTIKNSKFGDHALLDDGSFSLQLSVNRANITNNEFSIAKSEGGHGLIFGINIMPWDGRRLAEITITDNTFNLPEDYDDVYNLHVPGIFRRYVGIAAFSSNLKIFDNVFTSKYNRPGGYIYFPRNIHNIGVLAGSGTESVSVINNNFIDFDGAHVVTQSHAEHSYHDHNKQNVILKDNYLRKM